MRAAEPRAAEGQAADEQAAEGRAAETVARLWHEHAAGCLAYARTLAGPAGEDVVQEAFVKLVRHVHAHAHADPLPDRPKAWLLRVVRTTALDRRRTEARRRRREAAFAPPEPAADFDHVAAAVAGLPPDEREAVALHLWCGLTFAEVAELLGCAPATAHARYRRGLDRLRPILAEP